jgi:tRNA-binding protein
VSVVREEFGPTLPELVGRRLGVRTRTVWLALAAIGAVAVVVVAWLALRPDPNQSTVVVREPVTYNLIYPDALQRVAPRSGETLRLQSRSGPPQSFVVHPLRLQPYKGDVSAALTFMSARLIDEMRGQSHHVRQASDAGGQARPAAPRGRRPDDPRRPLAVGAEPRLGRRYGRAQDGLSLVPLRDRPSVTDDSDGRDLAWDEFMRVDMRVGRILEAEDFPEARRPAWKLRVDFGDEIGIRRSSAQITNYPREDLVGRLVIAVVNFPPKQIGPVRSECLVLGTYAADGAVLLLSPEPHAEVGDRVG